MVKLKRVPVWQPIEFDGAVFSSNTEGLIGIEECLDYDLDAILSSKGDKRMADEEDDKPVEQLHDKKKSKKAKTIKKEPQLLPSKQGASEFEVEEIKQNEDLLHPTNLTDLAPWNIVPLPDSILRALADQKYLQPTEIQRLTLQPSILGKRDILGAAETGSGKTLAFGLPILCGILKEKEKKAEEFEDEQKSDCSEDESDFEETIDELNENGMGCVRSINNIEPVKSVQSKPLYALILTPTRELAVQVRNHLVAAAKYTDIRVAVVVGGMAAVKQERILSKGPEIVVATPGRLWDLIQTGNPHLTQINDVKYLAIDETDRMLERGHFQELHSLLDRLNLDEKKMQQRQNFVFSATLTLVHEIPKHLISKKKVGARRKVTDMTAEQKLQKIVETLGISNPKIVDVTKGTGTSETLTECRISCAIDEKDFYVYYFLQQHPGRTLIFCNSIGCVKRLTTLLGLLGCHPLPLHASMQQRQRLKNLDKFRETENSILIATDVAARGLDIPCVEHVLHYQTPRTSEGYVHRSGRTARASRQGITILLVEPAELHNYLRLCRTLGKSEDIPLFPIQGNLLNAVKEIVRLARVLDKLELQVRKANSEAGWLEKAAKDMDILIDETTAKYDVKEANVYKKQAEIKRKQLAHLLSKPVFPKGFSRKYPLSSGLPNIPLVQGEHINEKAVDVMKLALESSSKSRMKPKILFKPKIKKNQESTKVAVMRKVNKKSKSIKRKNIKRK